MHVVYQWNNPEGHAVGAPAVLAASPSSTPGISAAKCKGTASSRSGNVQFKNYWTVFANALYFERAQDDRATRGGPSMVRPGYAAAFIGVESDSRKALCGCPCNRSCERLRMEARIWMLNVSLRYRPASSLEISAGPNFGRTALLAQYVDTFVDPGGRRHLRLALPVRDAESKGIQPADAGELRASRRRCRCRSTCSRSCRSALYRVQRVRAAADVRLHPLRAVDRQYLDLRPGGAAATP